LFVGEAARPDLAVEATEGARELYHSLQLLLELPDGVEVHPGHVSGSLCGAGMDHKRSTTIGFERRFNRAFAHQDETSS
jgi:glyoxylase-like metal-dependent hydrolase (beta-lactamase superfamily II)